MRHLIVVLSMLIISSCTNQSSINVSQTDFLKACDLENETSLECEKLHSKKIILRGVLYYPTARTKASVFPTGTKVPHHDDDDEAWDMFPEDITEVTILFDDKASDIDFKRYKSLHQKEVFINGIINTECVTKSRELMEETEAINKAKAEAGEDDEIIISIPAGFCHYYSEYVHVTNIAEMKK